MFGRFGLAFGGVVAFAGEDFVVVVAYVDFDFAKFAVAGGVGRVVAERVLAAERFGDLVEGFLKMLFVVGDNQATAGFFGHLFRDAGVSAKTRIGDEQNVDNSVGTLRRFDRFFFANLATFVLSVGDDEDGFAAGFAGQLFVAGEIDRVVERSAGDAAADWTRIDHASAHRRVDARLTNRAIEQAAVVGPVCEEIDVGIKRHDERFVSLAQHAIEKGASHLLNGAEHELFRPGGVEKQRESDWERHFSGEEGDLLVLTVFLNLEVLLLEVGDDAFTVVADGREDVDQVDLAADDRTLLRVLRRSRSLSGAGGRGAERGAKYQAGGDNRNQCRRKGYWQQLLHRTHVYFP